MYFVWGVIHKTNFLDLISVTSDINFAEEVREKELPKFDDIFFIREYYEDAGEAAAAALEEVYNEKEKK